MKKILAIAMAIVMMMAIAVPAFATIEYNDGTGAGTDTIIETLTTKEDGTDPTWYTVTIPASQTIYWEATSTTISYDINSQLATDDFVKVSVADADGAYLMTKDGSNATLAYVIADDDKAYTASAEVVVDEKDTVTIDTTGANWAGVPVDAYTDTLTFTAEIV